MSRKFVLVFLLGSFVSFARAEEAAALTATDLVPLSQSIAKDDVSAIAFAIVKDADIVRARGDRDWTLLHHAAYHGAKKCALLLLYCEADPSARATAVKKLHGFDAPRETPAAFARLSRKREVESLLSRWVAMTEPDRESAAKSVVKILDRWRKKISSAETSPAEQFLLDQAEAESKVARVILGTDAEKVSVACASVHEKPTGSSPSEVLRSARDRIAPAVSGLLTAWPESDRAALVESLRKMIGASGFDLKNNIRPKTVRSAMERLAGEHTAAAASLCSRARAVRCEAEVAREAQSREEDRQSQPILTEDIRFERDGPAVYACAKITNNSGKTIRLVILPVLLYDAAGNRVGQSSDSIQDWSDGDVWSYRALILDDRTTTFRFGEPSGF